MARLLAPICILLLLFLGYRWWDAQQPPEPAPPPPKPIAKVVAAAPLPDPAPSAVTLQPTQVALRMPTSPHAAALNDISALIEQKKDTEAEARLTALPAEAMSDPAVRTAAATLWNNLGTVRGMSRGPAAAVPAYKTALSINPADTIIRRNLFLCYRAVRDPALTPQFIEETLRLIPEEPLAHMAFAELLIDKDDLQGAMTHLNQAAERPSSDPRIKEELNYLTGRVSQAGKAEQRFVARDSSHFTVKFDGTEDYTVWRRVAEILEDAYRDIGQQLGYYPSKPVLVVLHTRESFHSATGGPAWSDGLYDPSLGRIKVPTQGALTDQDWLARVLRHEFVHALLHDRMKGRPIPQWLNEGLAMQLAGDPPPDISDLARGQVSL